MPVDRRPRQSAVERLSDQVRNRTALGRSIEATAAALRRRSVPLHWTNLFGVVSLACTVFLLVTGFLLMFFYTPSSELVIYHGSYSPLRGVAVSRAFESTMAISFEVRGGLLLRQAHHWAALLLPASLIIQLVVMFFTGGFRRPRQASWVLLFLLFIVALAGGWSGYALPDDMLSGTGLRIVEGILLGIPMIGTQLSMLLFGGEFPGTVIEHLYPIHVGLVPVLLVVLIIARVRLSYLHKPAQFGGPGRTDHNVVGVPMLPSAAARAAGMFAIATGLLLVMAATMTVSPIWLYGPSSPAAASAGSQPDWYTGFLDGALRLVPPGWEFDWFGRTWTLAILAPLAVVGVFLGLVMLYPYLEGWITRDRREHHILDRPRNAATRTGLGVAGLIFYGVLWGAASADIAATQFRLSLGGVLTALQIALLVGPVIGFAVARRICFALQRQDREIAVHGYETGQIVRLPDGGYVEIHHPVDRFERWRLIAPEPPHPLPPRPDRAGRLPLRERVRGRLARWSSDDHITLTGRPELDTAPPPDQHPQGVTHSDQ